MATMRKTKDAPAAPVCPECGCSCSRCAGRSFVPAFINTANPKLRTRDVLVKFTDGGRRAREVTSPEVAKRFGVSIYDASKRLRTLERSGCLRRLRRRARAIVFGVTEYGLEKAAHYAAMR
jgi:FaeA-like protein